MPRPSLVSSDGSRGWLFASYDDVPGTVNHGRSSRGQHWSKDRAHKAEWEGIFMVLFMHGALPKNLAHVKVWFKLEFFDPGRRRDPENFRHPLMKPFADTLVRGGYLADDTGEFFTCVDLQLSPEKLERTAAHGAPVPRRPGRLGASTCWRHSTPGVAGVQRDGRRPRSTGMMLVLRCEPSSASLAYRGTEV
jgi:hypothetical protein